MEFHFSKQSEKFLKKQDPATRNRILDAIHGLPEGDVKNSRSETDIGSE